MNRIIALAGRPNTGKTTLFNALTGMRQRTANFAGCTVEKATGVMAASGGDVEIVDLPGTFSMLPQTEDEHVAFRFLSECAGSPDDLLYGANRTLKPNTSGLIFQLDGTPFGAGGSPLGKRFNMRVGVQYTLYTRFNGASRDYDGGGANASDNNTLRVFTWIAY